MKNMHNKFLKMTKLQRVQFISVLLSMYLSFDIGIQSFVPSDYIKLAGCSFHNLNAAGVGNTLYFLARGIGELREDGSGPRMPLDHIRAVTNFSGRRGFVKSSWRTKKSLVLQPLAAAAGGRGYEGG